MFACVCVGVHDERNLNVSIWPRRETQSTDTRERARFCHRFHALTLSTPSIHNIMLCIWCVVLYAMALMCQSLRWCYHMPIFVSITICYAVQQFLPDGNSLRSNKMAYNWEKEQKIHKWHDKHIGSKSINFTKLCEKYGLICMIWVLCFCPDLQSKQNK